MNNSEITLTIMGSGALLLGGGVIWLTGTKPGEKAFYKCMEFGEKIVDYYKSKINKYK